MTPHSVSSLEPLPGNDKILLCIEIFFCYSQIICQQTFPCRKTNLTFDLILKTAWQSTPHQLKDTTNLCTSQLPENLVFLTAERIKQVGVTSSPFSEEASPPLQVGVVSLSLSQPRIINGFCTPTSVLRTSLQLSCSALLNDVYLTYDHPPPGKIIQA